MALKVLVLCVLATSVAAAPVEDVHHPDIHIVHGVPIAKAAHDIEPGSPDVDPHDEIDVVDGTPDDDFVVDQPEYNHKFVQEMESELTPPESAPHFPIHEQQPDFHLEDYTAYLPKIPMEHEPVPEVPKLPHGIPGMSTFGHMPQPIFVSPVQFKTPEHEEEPSGQPKNHHAETWIHSFTYKKEGYHH